MSQFVITTGLQQKITAILPLRIERDGQPFFSCVLQYDGMDAADIDQLGEKVAETVKAIQGLKMTGAATPDGLLSFTTDDLDSVLAVEVIAAQLIDALCEMGFAKAAEHGIAVPVADEMRKKPKR